MIKSDHKDDGSNAQDGSIGTVKYPDSCWVVKMDTALNIKAVYVDKDAYSNMNTSGKLAIADMDTKPLTWVTGVPAASDMANYSIGYGDGYNGYFYLPINPAEASTTGGGGGSWHHAKATRATSSAVPTIYRINAATGVATAFMTLDKNESVKVISIVKK